MIPNDRGEFTSPMYATWDLVTGNVVIGEDAQAQALVNPLNTAYDIKYLFGRAFNSTEVQIAIFKLPYKVVDQDNKPMIQVTTLNKTRAFSPEEITAMVLTKLKSFAEAYLGETVTDAVATVPACFDDEQRNALKAAGTMAGVTLQCVINEPTAATIAHGFHKKVGEDFVLVLNSGGLCFDVTLLAIDSGVFEVLALENDPMDLGADAFGKRIVNHCISKWKETDDINVSSDSQALQQLWREANRAKCALSSDTEVIISIELSGGRPLLTETLSRSEFEDMIRSQ